MFGMKKKMMEASHSYHQYIEEFQQRGLFKDGKISILKTSTGYEKSRDDDTTCDVCKFRCGKGAELYCLVIAHLKEGGVEVSLLGNIDFAVRLGGERFWYLDEYLKSYEVIGRFQKE